MSHRHHLALLPGVVALLTLGACSDTAATYEVTLEPIFAENQMEFMRQMAQWKLVLEYPKTDAESFELDITDGGYAYVERLPAMPADTVIAIEGYASRNDPSSLEAFGRSQPIEIGLDEAITVRILVAQVENFYSLADLEQLWGSAVASAGTGTYYLFSGYAGGYSTVGTAYPAIYKLDVAAPEDARLRFEEVATMPPTTDDGLDMVGRSYAQANLLTEGDHDHVGQILVTGGWTHTMDEGGATTYEAFYFDPETHETEPVVSASGDYGMRVSRAGHRVLELSTGNLMIIGGFSADSGVSAPGAVEIFDPSSNAITDFTNLDFAATLGDAAILGDRGAMYCGGLESLGTSWESTNQCAIINSVGIATREVLPDGAGTLLLPAMAPLDGNRVLVMGGFRDVRGTNIWDFTSTSRASTLVWMYDAEGGGTRWTEMEPMNNGRAYFKAVPLPDGRILVAGGASRMSGLKNGIVEGLSCAEIFDPDADENGEWTEVGTCDPETGTGPLPGPMVDPAAAMDPDYGVIFAGGLGEDNESVSFGALYVGRPTR